MSKKSFSETLRLPSPSGGIQVNFCKNPFCNNFAKQPLFSSRYDNNGNPLPAGSRTDPLYKKSGSTNGESSLHCKSCNSYTAIKSNKGIREEFERISSYLKPKILRCPNKECVNHSQNVNESNDGYKRNGKTRTGYQRYKCLVCGKGFSDSDNQRSQRRSEVNKRLYLSIVNKVPIKRACEMLEISPETYYRKIDFLHKQALVYVRERELKLFDQFHAKRIYLSSDRQSHFSNWTNRKDKKNCEFHAIGTACNRSGYVFGWHFNFDKDANTQDVEKEIDESPQQKLRAMRKHARLWTKNDLAQLKSTKGSSIASGSLVDDITLQCIDESTRANQEQSEIIDNTVTLPEVGMQVHSDYTMYAHFHLLDSLLQHVEKVHFYLDQDTGIKNAFISAFHKRITNGSADAFYVKVEKELSVNQKERLVAQWHKEFLEFSGIQHSSATSAIRREILQQMLVESMRFPLNVRGSTESWLKYPKATMAEPNKLVSPLTLKINPHNKRLSSLVSNASLHGIDRFFMQARRRVSMFERPFSSGTNNRRVWYGYSPYKPEMFIKLADLYRLFYNFVLKGSDGKTPAMRLGIARGAVSIEKIIYHNELRNR
ncbi:IS1 family transposase [Vibrio parahaemolyticus]|nr:IS1 family transposase [Vibrio parahaemolyticus]